MVHLVPNPQKGCGNGDFRVCCDADADSVELVVNHDGMNDNGEVILLGASPQEAVSVIDGLIEGLRKARALLERGED